MVWVTAYGLVQLAMAVVLIVGGRGRDHDFRLVPRCLRCDGPREFGHKCPDATSTDGAVDTRR